MDYLSEKEELLVMQFVQHKEMFEAVKKVVLAGLYDNGVLRKGKNAEPTRNFALALFFKKHSGHITNEALGEDLRASATAMEMLESSYNKMTSMVDEKKPKVEEKNQAR
jgi:hypothetical protein